MPFKSKAQAAYLFAKRPKGVNLKEWSAKTDWSKLPEKKAFIKGFAKTATQFLPAELFGVNADAKGLSSEQIYKRTKKLEKKASILPKLMTLKQLLAKARQYKPRLKPNA